MGTKYTFEDFGWDSIIFGSACAHITWKRDDICIAPGSIVWNPVTPILQNDNDFIDWGDLDQIIKTSKDDKPKDKNEITDPMYEYSGVCNHVWMLYKGLNLTQADWVYVCDKCGKEKPYES